MGQKKSKKILIVLIILVIILILLVGVAYCYFATDLLKSNKQLFFQYIVQMGDTNGNGIMDNELKQYFEKRKNTPYMDQGDFLLDITTDGTLTEKYKNVNNFNISFSGQVDTANNKAMQDISLDYSNEVNFPFSYKQIGNTIGLQTKYVSSKYIAIETDKLESQSSDEITNITNAIQGYEKAEELTNSPFTRRRFKSYTRNLFGCTKFAITRYSI